MPPLEASMTLATLVGLLCNWKQERGVVSQDRFQDFITWLEQHHFNDLRSRITSSDELQRELSALLKEDLESLTAKLDSITSGIAAVGSKLDHFASVIRVLGPSTDDLSDQATAILHKLYSTKEATCLLVGYMDADAHSHIFFEPSLQDYQVKEPRFLADELDSLCRLGFLKTRAFGKDEIAYYLTRSGATFATQVTPNASWIKEAPPIQMRSGGSFGY